MKVITGTKFVIETSMPTGKFKNKHVLNEHTGELETVPDGEPEREWMWFAGIGLHPSNPNIKGAVWTPYPAQGFQYKDKEEADAVNELILGKEAGGIVVAVPLSHWREGRQVIVPVSGQVVEAVSKSGIKGGRL